MNIDDLYYYQPSSVFSDLRYAKDVLEGIASGHLDGPASAKKALKNLKPKCKELEPLRVTLPAEETL